MDIEQCPIHTLSLFRPEQAHDYWKREAWDKKRRNRATHACRNQHRGHHH